MYNENVKEGFIKEYLKSRVIQETTLRALFKKTAQYEEQFGKDCGSFTKEEILNMYEGFRARSKFTVFNYNAILKAYSLWVAHTHGLDTNVAYNDITTEMIAPLIPKDATKLLSRDDVTDIEDQLYNHADKAIIELLFEGVSGKNMEDIYAVSADCIKSDKLVVNGKYFPLTPRLRELLPAAFDETETMSYGETMRIVQVNGKGRIYKERCNARGVYTDDAKFRFFYRKIQLIRDYLGIPGLTMKGLQSSGLWHNLNQGMKDSGLDLRGFLKTEQGKAIALRYGFSEDYYLENICAKYE